MAATAVYFRASRVSLDTHTIHDSLIESNISSTSSPKQLLGGLYEIEVIGSTFGTVTFQKLGPDDSSYLTQATAITANGTALVYCSPGFYRVALS